MFATKTTISEMEKQGIDYKYSFMVGYRERPKHVFIKDDKNSEHGTLLDEVETRHFSKLGDNHKTRIGNIVPSLDERASTRFLRRTSSSMRELLNSTPYDHQIINKVTRK